MATMRSGRVLVVDNDPHFRSSVEVLLDARGYTVFATGTRLEARHIALKERVHVAILDIRMESDPDHDDMSGLKLARQLDPLIVKIMLTAYPSVTAMRHSFGDVSAFNFVFKDEAPEALLEALKRAFTEKVKINFDLAISWQGIQLAEVIQRLELETKPTSSMMESEVEEILCKLFHLADEIVVTPLIPAGQIRSASQSGAVILKVLPHYEGGWAAPVVVKLAARDKIELEAKNYKQYIERFIDGFRHTLLQGKAQTHLLGGIIYTLVGAPLEECLDLGTFYATYSADEVLKALTDLFTKTCRHWYENRETRQTHDLIELYAKPLKLSVEKLETALDEAGLADWAKASWPVVPELGRAIVNPIEWFRHHPSLMANVSLAYTHGDLHGRNILIDHNHQAWLIDFYRSGLGHVFRDLIELESDIKFNLLGVTSLSNLVRFEIALLGARYFDDKLTLPNFQQPELKKAFIAVQGLRYIAGKLIGSSSSMLDYYQGLLLQTLAVICLRHVDSLKKRHAYLAASLLCRRLDQW